MHDMTLKEKDKQMNKVILDSSLGKKISATSNIKCIEVINDPECNTHC